MILMQDEVDTRVQERKRGRDPRLLESRRKRKNTPTERKRLQNLCNRSEEIATSHFERKNFNVIRREVKRKRKKDEQER